MKRTTLTPPPLKSLNIAIVSAILGLGAVSGANAQTQSAEVFFPNIFDSDYTEDLDSVYHNMILGKTAIKTDNDQYKFYGDDANEVPDSLFFNKMLHDQQLNGFKAGDKIIPLDKDGKPVYKLESETTTNGETKRIYSVTTKIATEEDVANSPYAHGIQKDIDDLYSFDQKVTDYLEEINIYNERQTGAIDALNKASSENTQNIEDLAAYNELQDAYAKQQTEAIDALNKASSENTQNIEDLAAYNELQDAYAKQQTEAIDALNKASSENTQNIEDLAAYNELQDAYAKQQTEAIDALNKASSANTDNIANNIDNIYELAQQQDQHSSDIKTLAKASAANKADADAKFKGVQTDIANNKITLAQHTKKINDNQKAIEAKLGGKVDTQKLVDLETKVNQNQGEVDKKLATVQENYSQLNTQVQSVDNKIGMVDTRINALDDKVENSMAAQAALNGLFQPYNVGKVSVSVAVGAYGSKSAIAVGAGYRVNPHLAFKGGAAINTSGSRKGSYNLGINYEF